MGYFIFFEHALKETLLQIVAGQQRDNNQFNYKLTTNHMKLHPSRQNLLVCAYFIAYLSLLD